MASRQTRRRVLSGLAGGMGGVLILASAGPRGVRPVFAQSDDEPDDDGNSGSGGGDDDHSGHGGGGDDGETVPVTGEIPAGTIEVRIVNDDLDGFSPANLTVDIGQSVTFVNGHDDAHTATGSGFDTGIMQPGQTATVVLSEAGTFAYACQIHPVMTGTIAVRGADGVVPAPAPAAAPPGATTVRITALAFSPASIEIATGTTVAWMNDDSVPHTVTAGGSFDSGIFDPGGTFSWTFGNPGAFTYQCDLHPQMQGQVIVTGEAVAVSQAQEPVPVTTDQPTTQTTADTANQDVASDDAVTSDAFVGAWRAEFAIESALPSQQALLTIHDDGTIAADFAAAGEASDDLGLAIERGQGVWQAGDDGTYRLTLMALLVDADGHFAGTMTLRDSGQLAGNGKTYQGSFQVEITDPDGVAVATADGSAEWSRIAVDAEVATPEAAATTPAAASAAVEMRDLAFAPATLEVAVGTTVTWTNNDTVPHTATAEDGSFDTGQLDTGQSGEVTFDTPGTFAYVCLFHPNMAGTVTVR
jgi:plastocyanin